jgi:hypothetical protein
LSYPFFTTLGHFWIKINGGNTSMPLYPIFYICFLLVTYSQLKRILPEDWLLPGLLFLAVTPKMFDQSLVAYANLPYTIYLILGAVYLFLWTRENQKTDLILGIALLLFSYWVRSFPFALAPVLAVLMWHPKTRKPMLLAGSAAALLILIRFFDLSKLTAAMSFFKWSIMDYFFPYTWIFLVLAGWQLFKRKGDTYWLLTILFYLLLFAAGTYFYADINPDFAQIPDAAQRMMMFLAPSVLWYLYSLV